MNDSNVGLALARQRRHDLGFPQVDLQDVGADPAVVVPLETLQRLDAVDDRPAGNQVGELAVKVDDQPGRVVQRKDIVGDGLGQRNSDLQAGVFLSTST